MELAKNVKTHEFEILVVKRRTLAVSPTRQEQQQWDRHSHGQNRTTRKQQQMITLSVPEKEEHQKSERSRDGKRSTLGADVDTCGCLFRESWLLLSFVRACLKSHHSDMQSTAQQSHCVNTVCGLHEKHGDKEGASSTCDEQCAASRELTFHDTVSRKLTVNNSREDDKKPN